MTSQLREIQATTGAKFDDTTGIPLTFGNDLEARKAANEGIAIVDRTHWGRIRISGDDRLRFLHNQTTNNFNTRQPGDGCDTVFVTSTARTIDLATAYITDEAVLLLVSPQRRQTLMEWIDRYIFPMDKVELEDGTEATAAFSLLGAKSGEVVKSFGAENLETYGSHQVVKIADFDVRIAVGSGLGNDGFTFVVDTENSAKLWQELTQKGAIPLGQNAWEQLRVEAGRPLPDAELTEDFNPLEAGLWQTISFEKGCYIGQETIARLNTYQGVKQQLWGIRLSARVEPGTVVTLGDEKVGKLTSIVEIDGNYFGLAYIRVKAGGAGLEVKLDDATGTVENVSFLSRGYLENLAAAL